MTELSDLDALVRTWRKYIADHKVGSEYERTAGYLSALAICADQLEKTLNRMRADA